MAIVIDVPERGRPDTTTMDPFFDVAGCIRFSESTPAPFPTASGVSRPPYYGFKTPGQRTGKPPSALRDIFIDFKRCFAYSWKVIESMSQFEPTAAGNDAVVRFLLKSNNETESPRKVRFATFERDRFGRQRGACRPPMVSAVYKLVRSAPLPPRRRLIAMLRRELDD
jgi:hypothetical protein